MEILVLEHERDAPAGLLGDWARERGHNLRVLDVPSIRSWPDAGAADAIVSLGSERSVHASAEPWIEDELALLRDAHARNQPVLGICFGAQALAAALGGEVARADRLWVEWSTLDSAEQSLIPRGPWLRWHEDVFSVPPGARTLASADGVPQAFATGSSVGVQFHPEADEAIMRGWVAASRQRLRARARELDGVQRLLEREPHAARERALDLFDRIARLWGRS